MNQRLYDLLRFLALVILPGAGALYFALGNIWNFPAVEQVSGSILALETFIGLLIKKSSKDHERLSNYGDLVVQQDAEGTVQGMRLEANRELLIFPDQKDVIFKVRRQQD